MDDKLLSEAIGRDVIEYLLAFQPEETTDEVVIGEVVGLKRRYQLLTQSIPAYLL